MQQLAASLAASSAPGTAGGRAAPAPRLTKADTSLANLQNRTKYLYANLQELHDTARQLRDGMGEHRQADWEWFVKRFSMTNKLVTQLSDDLDRALSDGLDSFVAVPVAATADPSVLPELLRTRDETAVEKELDEHRRGFADAARADPSLNDPPATAARVRAFNAFVEEAVDKVNDMRELLASRAPEDPPPSPPPQIAEKTLAALAYGAEL